MKKVLGAAALAITLAACGGSDSTTELLLNDAPRVGQADGFYVGKLGEQRATVIVDGSELWLTYGGQTTNRAQYWVMFGGVDAFLQGSVYDTGSEADAEVMLTLVDGELRGTVKAEKWQASLEAVAQPQDGSLPTGQYYALATKLVPFHSSHLRVTFEVLADGSFRGSTETGCRVDGQVAATAKGYSRIEWKLAAPGCDDQKFTGVIYRADSSAWRAIIKNGKQASSILIFNSL